MGELDAELRSAVAAAGSDDVRERRLAAVGIEAEAAMGDAAMALHMGRLHDQQPGARISQHAEMGQVPVARAAVIGAVLAHRRDRDAIVQREAGKLDRREQLAGHEGRDRRVGGAEARNAEHDIEGRGPTKGDQLRGRLDGPDFYGNHHGNHHGTEAPPLEL